MATFKLRNHLLVHGCHQLQRKEVVGPYFLAVNFEDVILLDEDAILQVALVIADDIVAAELVDHAAYG